MGSSISSGGDIDDYTLFHSLTEYRSHNSIRHIAWKRFAATGVPVVKTYDQSSWPGISIYLDTRRIASAEYNMLEAEDCSVETTVSLLHYFVTARIPVDVRIWPWGTLTFQHGNTKEVYRFIEKTVNLYFGHKGFSSFSPHQLLHMDINDNAIRHGHILVITHIFDSHTINVCTDFMPSGQSVSVIFNLTGMDGDTKEKAELFSESVSEEKQRIHLVRGPETIREDLS